MSDATRVPVIAAIGEAINRNSDPQQSREPAQLMADALADAGRDGGTALLDAIGLVTVIGLSSWRYADVAGEVCRRAGIDPAEKVNAGYGGESPIRLIHEAAVRIAAGEPLVAAVMGGEASASRSRARRSKAELPWTPLVREEPDTRVAGRDYEMDAVVRRLRVLDPVNVYPFYEMAAQAAWGQTPAQGQAESAALWERYAAGAAANDAAWLRSAPDAAAIGQVGPDNRMIAFPYPKLMVANPGVNQAGVVIVTSLARARELGIPEERLIHVWGGAAARESDDYLRRDRYDRSAAQAAVLDAAVGVAGGDAGAFDYLELYSCFPVVPKMAYRVLGLDPAVVPPTVAGGLTFFGGPLNNYMTHATCAMVRRMRADGGTGLLYGQGGYVNKHHALVVSAKPPPQPLALEYSVQNKAEAMMDPVPELRTGYEGPAQVETYTVRYGRGGTPTDGLVIARLPDNGRAMARVAADDAETLERLQDWQRSAVGLEGRLRTDAFGKPCFEAGAAPRRYPAAQPRFAKVERDGPLTVVTINRPEAMNALHPAANAELSDIFDEFQRDPDQWVAILTGAGDRAFSAGNDLKETARLQADGQMPETPLKGFAGLTSRFDMNKPVIAAVNGIAMGGGFEIALACDLIVASANAEFALPEPKVGLAALAGGLIRLPREVGLKKAMSMILTGRRVPAREAEALGFVAEVAEPAELMATARRWAAAILENSPMSVRASKEVVHAALDAPTLADASRMQFRAPAVAALMKSADVREGPLAFAQKRSPRWQGR